MIRTRGIENRQITALAEAHLVRRLLAVDAGGVLAAIRPDLDRGSERVLGDIEGDLPRWPVEDQRRAAVGVATADLGLAVEVVGFATALFEGLSQRVGGTVGSRIPPAPEILDEAGRRRIVAEAHELRDLGRRREL